MTLEKLVIANIVVVLVSSALPHIYSCIRNRSKKIKLNGWVKKVEAELKIHVPVENEKITIALASVSKENFVDELAKSEINFVTVTKNSTQQP